MRIILCKFLTIKLIKFTIRDSHLLFFKLYRSVSWCLACGSAEKPGCTSSGHSFVDMTTDSIRNLEGLLKSKEELMKMKDTGMKKLTMAIEERKQIQEQLALILKSIRHSEEEIMKLQDENNV